MTFTVPAYNRENLVQRPTYESRWLRWVGEWNLANVDDGSGGQPNTNFLYKVNGDSVKIRFGGVDLYKVGDGSAISLSGDVLPFDYANAGSYAGIGIYVDENTTGTRAMGLVRTHGGDRKLIIHFLSTVPDNDYMYGNTVCEYRIN